MSRYRQTGGVKNRDGRGWPKKDNSSAGSISYHHCVKKLVAVMVPKP